MQPWQSRDGIDVTLIVLLEPLDALLQLSCYQQGGGAAMADAGLSQAELLHMQQRITEQMVYASQAIAPYMAAVVGTFARHLSGECHINAPFAARCCVLSK